MKFSPVMYNGIQPLNSPPSDRMDDPSFWHFLINDWEIEDGDILVTLLLVFKFGQLILEDSFISLMEKSIRV